jgi:hypothetical protein
MTKIIIRQDIIRISEKTFKEILIAIAEDGEVQFSFEDEVKRAKLKYDNFVVDVMVRKKPNCSDEMFVVGGYYGSAIRRAVKQKLLREMNGMLKSKYEIKYEDIEI